MQVSERDSQNTIDRKIQFHGLFLRGELLAAISGGTMSKTDALLCAYIDAYSKCKDGICWASNKTLAALVGVNQKYVSFSLSRMRAAGIIESDKVGESRYLRVVWTGWSQFTPPGDSDSTVQDPSRKNGNPPRKNGTPSRKNGECRPEKTGSPMYATSNNTPSRKNGMGPSTKNNMSKRDSTVQFRLQTEDKSGPLRLAKLLHSRLAKKGQEVPILSKSVRFNWTKAFKRLLDEMPGSDFAKEKRVSRAIKNHTKYIDDQYQPRAFNANDFCIKYSRIVDAMNRRRKESTENMSYYKNVW